jgi:hypothetical protein
VVDEDSPDKAGVILWVRSEKYAIDVRCCFDDAAGIDNMVWGGSNFSVKGVYAGVKGQKHHLRACKVIKNPNDILDR